MGILDRVLSATAEQQAQVAGLFDEFRKARTLEDSLEVWIRHSGLAGSRISSDRITRLINRDIGRIDRLVNEQVNAILHHPRFQKLEGSWRGLQYLCSQVEDGSHIKVRVLDVSWKTLARDLDRSIEFDQNQLFRKVYSAEFGNPGGEPFSVLLGDYEIRPRASPGSPIDDLDAVRSISQVAAASFAPFITAAHPSMFGLNSFTELQRPMDLAAIFQQPEFVKWRSLRATDDGRFVGMVLPRVLIRRPYETATLGGGFPFHEDVSRGIDDHLWCNACYAFGAVLARAFAQSAWLADIRGVRRDLHEGGLVTGLPSHSFRTDSAGIALRSSTDVVVTDNLEKDLSELGFIPLADCKDTDYAAFYSNSSIQDPKKYQDEGATANARISSMLQYILCVSRLAHYLKVMGRDKVGSFIEPADCESYLNDWLQQYVTQDDDAPAEAKAKFPLREANAQVRELPGKPGSYGCVIHLQPHYQLDAMSTGVRLTTELAPASG